MKQLCCITFCLMLSVSGEPLVDRYMTLLIKGVITRHYIYNLKYLNVSKKIQKSFGIFDSFCICISLQRDYSESTIARVKHLKHQEAFCV